MATGDMAHLDSGLKFPWLKYTSKNGATGGLSSSRPAKMDRIAVWQIEVSAARPRIIPMPLARNHVDAAGAIPQRLLDCLEVLDVTLHDPKILGMPFLSDGLFSEHGLQVRWCASD